MRVSQDVTLEDASDRCLVASERTKVRGDWDFGGFKCRVLEIYADFCGGLEALEIYRSFW